MIELKGIVREYRNGDVVTPALTGIDLCIGKGEFAAVMGASGSGKTTLLHIIGCMDAPTSGIYRLDGEHLERASEKRLSAIRGQKISFVFLRQVRKIDRNVRYIHALFFSELAAVYYGTDNFRCIYFFYAQADQTIIDQNCVSLFDIFRKACVADRTVIFISGLLNGCQGEGLSGYQIYFFSIF